MNKVSGRLCPRGCLRLSVYEQGQLIEQTEGGNRVVGHSKLILSRLAFGDSAWAIKQIGFGVNGEATADSDSMLTSAYVKAIASVTYPSQRSIAFNFSLDAGEAVGKPISEMGLLSANGALFARKTRASPLVKTAVMAFSGSWIITF